MKKVYRIIFLYLFIFVMSIGASFAWYTWSTTGEQNISVNVNFAGLDPYIDYSVTKNESNPTVPYYDIDFNKTEEGTNFEIYGSLYLKINSVSDPLIFKASNMKWFVYKNNTTIVSSGNFVGEEVGNKIPIYNYFKLDNDSTYQVKVEATESFANFDISGISIEWNPSDIQAENSIQNQKYIRSITYNGNKVTGFTFYSSLKKPVSYAVTSTNTAPTTTDWKTICSGTTCDASNYNVTDDTEAGYLANITGLNETFTGGTFYLWVKADDDTVTNTMKTISINSNGDAVARNGDIYYLTLQSALDNPNSGTITMLKDVSLTAPVSLVSTKSATLDLNGKTISNASTSYNYLITNEGTLNITGTGTISSSVGNIDNTGNLTISNGTITSSSSTSNTIRNNGGSVNLTGGTVQNSSSTAAVYLNNTTLNISGNATIKNTATIPDGENANRTVNAIIAYNSSPINLNGGNISSNGYAINSSTSGNITINGSTISSTSGDGIWQQGTGTITMNSGTISAGASGIWMNNSSSTLNITDGSLSGQTGIYDWYGNVNVYGGTVRGTGSGINVQSTGILSIGTNDDTISQESPAIISDSYVAILSSAPWKWYDGALYGNNATYNYNIAASTIPSSYFSVTQASSTYPGGYVTYLMKDTTAPAISNESSASNIFTSSTMTSSNQVTVDGNKITTTGGDPFIVYSGLSLKDPQKVIVNLNSAVTKAFTFQVFYATSGAGFSEANSVRKSVAVGDTKIEVDLNLTGIYTQIRFDFGGDSNVTFDVAGIDLVTNNLPTSKYINATITDDGSGISHYAITTSNTTPTTWTAITNTKNYNLRYAVSESRTYYIWVKDAIGNISNKSVNVIQTFESTITSGTGGSINVQNVTTGLSTNVTSGGTGTLIINYGDSIRITATADDYYRLNALKHGSTSITSGSSYVASSNETISVTWTGNKVHFNFKTNGGTIRTSTTSDAGVNYTWAADSNGLISMTSDTYPLGTNEFYKSKKGTAAIDLPNWNNSKYLYISLTGYNAVTNAQWKCLGGACNIGQTYSHAGSLYTGDDFCNSKVNDCTVVLGVNWTVSNYTVTFDPNGGSVDPTAQTVTYNSTYGTLPTPTRDGYEFNGWYTDSSGGSLIESSTNVSITAAQTLYAHWTLIIITIDKPTNSLCVSRTYNGSAQTLTSATSGTGYTLSGYSQTNAGTHTITATLSPNYQWSGGDTSNATFSCSMSKATPGITLSATSGTVVKGKTLTFTATPTASPSTTGTLTATSGTTSVATVSPASTSSVTTGTAKTITVTGVGPGSSTITVKYTPTDTTNFNSISKTYTATIKDSATPPTNSLCVSRTYNGSAQTLTSATSGTGYTLSGYSQTSAGSHTITATLASGYRWNDNTTGTKTFSCSISKATPGITLSATSGTVVKGKTLTFTATPTASPSTTGTLTATSGTTSVATVSPASTSSVTTGTAKTITVTGVGPGSSTITVKYTPTDTTNFNSISKTYTATIKDSATPPTTSLCVSRTYTGSAQTLTSATSGTGYTLSGYSQTNAGSYTITATLASGYRWNDNTTGTKTFSCSIAVLTVTIPSASNKTYNGGAQTGVSSNSRYTLKSGTYSATTVGSYSATVDLNDKSNTKWSDGTTTSKTIAWSISSATPSFTAGVTINGTARSYTISSNTSYKCTSSGCSACSGSTCTTFSSSDWINTISFSGTNAVYPDHLTLAWNDAGNYTGSFSTSLTGSENKGTSFTGRSIGSGGKRLIRITNTSTAANGSAYRYVNLYFATNGDGYINGVGTEWRVDANGYNVYYQNGTMLKGSTAAWTKSAYLIDGYWKSFDIYGRLLYGYEIKAAYLFYTAGNNWTTVSYTAAAGTQWAIQYSRATTIASYGSSWDRMGMSLSSSTATSPTMYYIVGTNTGSSNYVDCRLWNASGGYGVSVTCP